MYIEFRHLLSFLILILVTGLLSSSSSYIINKCIGVEKINHYIDLSINQFDSENKKMKAKTKPNSRFASSKRTFSLGMLADVS